MIPPTVFDPAGFRRYHCRMFGRLGASVARHPLAWVVGWIVFAIGLAFCAPDMGELIRSEPDTLLPVKAPSNQAFEFLLKAFPQSASRSQVIVVVSRPSGLSAADRAYMKGLTQRLVEESNHRSKQHTPADTWRVVSSDIQPFLAGKLISRDKQIGLIVVNLSVNFVTMRAKQSVETVERLAQMEVPKGLDVVVTGSAGVGRDYTMVARAALDRTMWVTILAVMLILAIVYRSPLAAMVPLFSIGLSVFGAFKVLNLLAWAGWSVSSIERMFTVVLLFGAGTDYALFWIARYREELIGHADAVAAASRTMVAVGPAIVASAGTIIFGLTMLVASEFVLSHNSGEVLGPVVALSTAASMTLVPALAVLMGGKLFWPGRLSAKGIIGQQNLWPRLASMVVARPWAVLLAGGVCLGIPIWNSVGMKFRYDTIAELPLSCPSTRGANLAQAHFPPGEAYVTTLVVRHPSLKEEKAGKALSDRLTPLLRQVGTTSDVRSLSEPLGMVPEIREQGRMVAMVGGRRLTQEYVSPDTQSVRFDVVIRSQPFVEESFDTVAHLEQQAVRTAEELFGGKATVLSSGLTPYMIDIKSYSLTDHRRVTILVVAVILVIVYLLTRDAPLSIFMLAATLVTYLATLGLCEWVFTGLLGWAGVDWKAKLFLFVIIVAVGQDYNIFLVTRLFQEGARFELSESVERAIVRTGSIISSCGVIMAATLGSLMASGLKLMEQLGFAMSAGILIDTFVVRPLLIPAFHLLRVRLRSRWANRDKRVASTSGALVDDRQVN